MNYIIFHIFLAFIFVFFSAFFSGAETALFSLNRARILDYSSQDDYTRKCIVELMNDYQRTLIAIVLGNMFMNASLSICINGIIMHFSKSPILSLIISLFISLIILLLGGEVTPKALAILNAEKISNIVALPLWYYKKTVMPLIILVEKFHSLIWNKIGRKQQPPLSHEEYYSFIEMAADIDAFSDSEKKIIEKILDFNEFRISKLVNNRMEIHCIKKTMTIEEVKEIIRKSRQKFIPVVNSSIDDAEMILSSKRFFLNLANNNLNWLQSDSCFNVTYIPEGTTLKKALPIFFQKRVPAALAIDEFGGVTGIISKKDIYERIFGEISEEFEKSNFLIKKINNSTWELKGNILLEDLKEKIPSLSIPTLEASTLNGAIIEILSDFPSEGDEVQLGNATVKIKEISKKHITRFEINIQKKKK
ncbi:MAG TPA: CNNM domain-containing protein [Victivallales bacterium]|nr:CNNM domain-containing protein [Victivallales bacterium]HRR06210.1 CNNM domain-containing protein [Victivallales bacterium]HRR28854.1 CNNM domain-containing protein [Victivallales bacterium]